MEGKNLRIQNFKLVSFAFFVVAYVLLMAWFRTIDNYPSVDSMSIFFCSWLGIIVFICYVLLWKKITNKFFTPFTIFLIFFTAFNFGQCLLWAFNVHSAKEIGKGLVFNSIYANNYSILKAQILYIICFISINTGAILFWKKNNSTIVPFPERKIANNSKYKILYITSIIMSIYSIPVTLFTAFQKLRFSQIYSYHDLYYGDINQYFSNPILAFANTFFFLSLIGLLIGSNYKKGTRYFVYSVFGAFSILTLLSGDRGEWVNPLIFLVWMHLSFYKKMHVQKTIFWFVVSFLGLHVISAIVSLRNTGLSFDGFINNLFSNDNSIIKSLLLEFGTSMGICIILLQNTVSFPYGNTYLMSIPTMFGTGIANRIFGMNYIQLHTWFPLYYLNVNYGTDFSIIGEAMLNYGILLTPFVLFIEGIIIGKIYNYPFVKNENPLKLCLCINAMMIIIKIARSTFWYVLNSIAIATLAFLIIYMVVRFFEEHKLTRHIEESVIE